MRKLVVLTMLVVILAGCGERVGRYETACGDYNMIPGEDQTNFDAMNPSNFLRFVSSEDLAGQISLASGSGESLRGGAP